MGESERAAAFAQRLRELGWIDGRTVAIEYRWAEGRNERFAEIAQVSRTVQEYLSELEKQNPVADPEEPLWSHAEDAVAVSS